MVSDTCGKRFGWQLGELPFGYDHKYIYSNLGYNLKVSEMQAAIGLARNSASSRSSSPRAKRMRAFFSSG